MVMGYFEQGVATLFKYCINCTLSIHNANKTALLLIFYLKIPYYPNYEVILCELSKSLKLCIFVFNPQKSQGNNIKII